MAIESLYQVTDASTSGQSTYYVNKVSTTRGLSHPFCSLWRTSGFPVAAALPPSGNGESPTKTTQGAIFFPDPIEGVADTYLSEAKMSGSAVATLILYDRVYHNYGLDSSTTSFQAITSPTISRYVGEPGVEIFIEVYAGGLGSSTPGTVSYTNHLGVSGRTGTFTLTSSYSDNTMLHVQLEAGDSGVKSVQGFQMSGTSLTGGTYGITLAKRIVDIPVYSDGTVTRLDFIGTGMPKIHKDACLAFISARQASSTGNWTGSISLIQG